MVSGNVVVRNCSLGGCGRSSYVAMRFCFPKSARLKRASEFRRVKEQGRATHGKYLLLGTWATGQTHPAKVGLITSGRIGCAVERNRVRRRLRELARKMRPEIQPGLDLVIIARRSAVSASFEQLQQDWLRTAEKAGILRAATT